MVALGAGVLAGLLQFPALPVAAAGGLAMVLLRRTRYRPAGAALVAGLAIGQLERVREQGSCAARLPRGEVRVAVVVQERMGGDRVLVRPDRAGCRGTVEVRWPPPAVPAPGWQGEVGGRWLPTPGPLGRPDGLLLGRTAEQREPAGRVPTAGRFRESLAESIHRLYGGRGPMVEALVLGRRAGLHREVRDAFARAGLVHLLAISGFHVGVVAGWSVLLLRLTGLGAPGARTGAVAVAWAYVALLGFPPPATRAAALVGLLMLSSLRQRRVQPEPLLAVCLLIVLLLDPWAVGQLGAWLSAAAIWGVTRCTRWSDHRLSRRWLVRTLSASVGATLATAPFTAGVLGTVALVGIGLNLVAIPLAAAAIPTVLAALVAGPWLPALAESLAAGSGLLLAALEQLALAGAAVPFGSMTPTAGWSAAVPWVGVLLVLVWVLDRDLPLKASAWRLAAATAAAVWLVLGLRWGPLGPAEPGLTLHHLNVGQGDATALRTPGGRWVLVDAGPAGHGQDAGRAVVVPFLRRHGARRIAVLIGSHAHADHVGGAASVLEALPVDLLVEPGVPVGDSLYLALLDRVEAAETGWRPGRAGDRWELDGVRFTVLHPDTAWAEWRLDLNEDSLVLLVEYGGFRALLTGDAGFRAEHRLAGRVGDVSLLKVGHHGSRTATGAGWLAELAPEVAVLSLGRNRYGHPSRDALARLGASGSSVWRTDQEGTVSVWTDGRRWRVRSRHRQETYSVSDP